MRVIAAIGLFCAQIAAVEAVDTLAADQTIRETLSPGETRHYQVALRAGRNHVQLLEFGIDVVLSVRVGDLEYSADSPTARFALEQVWFDLATDHQAIVTVAAVRSLGVPPGEYTIEFQSAYSPPAGQLQAEQFTSAAIDSFNASYAADLLVPERIRHRETSLNIYVKAATAWEDLGDSRNAAYCWHAAGFISSVLMSQHADAQIYLERAARQYGIAQLPEHKQVARKDVGQAIYREERYSTAAAYLAEMAALTNNSSDRSAFIGAVASNELCLLYKELGRFELAISHCERGMAAFERIGDVIEYNNTLHNLAIARRLNGDQAGAIELLYDLLARHEAVDEPVRHAKTLAVLVGNLIDAGNIDAALAAYDQSIKVFEREGLPIWQATLLIKYARIEQMLGRDVQARLHLEKALKLVKATNSRRTEGVVTVALAEIDQVAGRPAAAIPALQRAVRIFREIESMDLRISASVALANAQIQAGWLEQAGATLATLGDEGELHADARANVMLTRARILAGQEQLEKATDLARQAAEGFEAIGSLTGQLEATNVEAELLSRLQRWDEALARLESLRVIVRRIGRTLVLPQLKARFFSKQQDFYEALIRAYEHASDTSDNAILRTLNIIEEARATALRAYLEAPSSWLDYAPPEMRTQYDEARQTVASLVQDSFNKNANDQQELIQALHHLERIQNSIWHMHPRFAELGDEEPVTWSQVDSILDEKTVILYLYAGKNEQFAVLLEKGQRMRYELVLDRSVEELTNAVLEEFRTPNSGFGVRAASAHALSTALFEPIAERLATFSRLIVVADGGLHTLPFAALPHPESSRPLLETHEFSNIPSLRAALAYGDSNFPDLFQVAAIGDPVTSKNDPRLRADSDVAFEGLDRLWGSRDELHRVQQVFGPDNVSVYTGFGAKKTLFLGAELAGSSILHISAHGVSNESVSARSGVFLTTMDRDGHEIDGHLGIEDLFGLELNIRLAVLSGCETSLGEQTRSEGPIGIARAFQYSGVPNVVSTLWRIDDKSSAILIETFYELLVAGETVPSALRSAQLALMQSAEYRHPYYWAAFQSLGDWTLHWENQGSRNTDIAQVK